VTKAAPDPARQSPMYVLVQHYVSNPRTFWSDVRSALPTLPQYIALRHCFPTPDGTHAVCVWEAESVEDVRGFLEAYVGHVSRNLYFAVENETGIAIPTRLDPVPGAVPGG
jgi:hypothetical protein